MDERIIYQRDDGGISIVVPSGELTLNETAAKDVPGNTPFQIVDKSEVPSDRTFRNAWELNGNRIVTNLEKAKSIVRSRTGSNDPRIENAQTESALKVILSDLLPDA